ncbi:MAG: Iron-sulfur cluster carrier protein [Methanoregula sp. SKADARSKE-2]|nr:MAG: Iron-sulfur cluster carrier protein [Methanoregula sp. SKADARSKE-2]
MLKVAWGALDYLVVDLPPGTGDEALSIVQLALNVRGAVIGTKPQDVAVMDAIKAPKFIEKLELPVLGVIENMSGMICPHCGKSVSLFGEGAERGWLRILAYPILVRFLSTRRGSGPGMRVGPISSVTQTP